jgi:hypothetical protein
MTQDQFDKFCELMGTALELEMLEQHLRYIPEGSVEDIETVWMAYQEDLRSAVTAATIKHFGGIVNEPI